MALSALGLFRVVSSLIRHLQHFRVIRGIKVTKARKEKKVKLGNLVPLAIKATLD